MVRVTGFHGGRSVTALLVALVALALCACGSASTSTAIWGDAAATPDSAPAQAGAGAVDLADAPMREIDLGQTVETDEYAFTIDSAYWADEVFPQETTGPYTWLHDQEGATYYVVRGQLSNLTSRKAALQVVTHASIRVDGKVVCAGKVNGVPNGARHIADSPVPPGATQQVFIVFEVPDGAVETCKAGDVYWIFDPNQRVAAGPFSDPVVYVLPVQ